MEGVVGIGCVFGPVMGSFVYNYVGFATTFYIFGGAMAPSCIFVLFIGKKPVDDETDKKGEGIIAEYDEVRLECDDTGNALLPDTPPSIKVKKAATSLDEPAAQEKKFQLTYSKLLCNPRINFAAMACGVSSLANGFLEPTLSLRLADYPEVTQL